MKTVFMHIPKTGGIALERAIEAGAGAVRVCPAYQPADYAGKSHADLPGFDFYKGHCSVDFVATLPRGFRKITVVRRPEDLLLSLYNHIASRPSHPRHAAATAEGTGFARHVGDHRAMHNLLAKYLLGDAAYRRICLDRTDPVKTRIDRARATVRENLSRFDLVGTTPHLDAFAGELSGVLGIAIPVPKRENANPRTVLTSADLTEEDQAALKQATWVDRPLFQMIRTEFLAPKYGTAKV